MKMSRSLQRLGIEEHLVSQLSAGGFVTVGDLISASPLLLMQTCNLSWKDADQLIARLSHRISPHPMNVKDLYDSRRLKFNFISTGIANLDKALEKGLLLGTLSDICGPPGIGKTQFCLTLAVHHLVCSMKDQETLKSVVFIDTELKFDPSRVIEIAIESYPDLFSADLGTLSKSRVSKLLDSIKVIVFVWSLGWCYRPMIGLSPKHTGGFQ
jgi:RAD51-like protein 1